MCNTPILYCSTGLFILITKTIQQIQNFGNIIQKCKHDIINLSLEEATGCQSQIYFLLCLWIIKIVLIIFFFLKRSPSVNKKYTKRATKLRK